MKTFFIISDEEFEVEIEAQSITYTSTQATISPEITFKPADSERLAYALARWQREQTSISFRSEA